MSTERKGKGTPTTPPLRLSLTPCVGHRASRSIDAWEYLPNFPPFRRLPRRLLLHGHFTKMLTSQLESTADPNKLTRERPSHPALNSPRQWRGGVGVKQSHTLPLPCPVERGSGCENLSHPEPYNKQDKNYSSPHIVSKKTKQ